jgi:hypothetical protein
MHGRVALDATAEARAPLLQPVVSYPSPAVVLSKSAKPQLTLLHAVLESPIWNRQALAALAHPQKYAHLHLRRVAVSIHRVSRCVTWSTNRGALDTYQAKHTHHRSHYTNSQVAVLRPISSYPEQARSVFERAPAWQGQHYSTSRAGVIVACTKVT